MTLLMLLTIGLAAPGSSLVATPPPKSVYFDQYDSMQSLDQATFESPEFWRTVDTHLPQWRSKKNLRRFRGFTDNLRGGSPGRSLSLPNGQEVLEQYIFPGIDESPAAGKQRSKGPPPTRTAFPDTYPALERVRGFLERDVAPAAKRELDGLLAAQPLVSDDCAEVEDGDSWHRAAWYVKEVAPTTTTTPPPPRSYSDYTDYDSLAHLASSLRYGWQFLSLRGAQEQMPDTVAALWCVVPAGEVSPVAKLTQPPPP